jgi:beta-phosphoglucomutase-like phosphatase (HAD superfamily)
MGIDMASVYAAKYRKNPDILRAAVMGQSPDQSLDSYTALNALRLVKEADMMAMSGQAQQPTSSPSLVAQALAPAPSAQGLGAMVPNTMGQAPQGMPPQGMPPQGAPQQRAPMPQQPMQAASGGLAGMYSPEEDYAAGGIVAFSGDDDEQLVRDEAAPAYVYNENDPTGMRVLESEAVDPDLYDDTDGTETGFLAAQRLANKRIAGLDRVKRKDFDRKGFIKDYMDQIKREGGADIYAPEIARGAEDEADRARARRTGEANAYFTAAGKILKGHTLAMGASEALPAYGSEINKVEQADQAAKVANSKYQFALKDAQRKERMGDVRGAAAAAELARKYEQDENKFEFDKARYGADVAVRNVQANRPLRGTGTGTGGEGKLPQVDRRAGQIAEQIVDLKAKDPNDPRIPGLVSKLNALKEVIGVTKDVGPNKLGAQESQIFVGAAKDSSATARKRLYTDPVMRTNDPVAMNKRYRELYAEEIQSRFPNAPLSELLSQMPAAELGSVAAPAAGNSSSPTGSTRLKFDAKGNQIN